MTALQIVRKSPETTVQLSLSDTQYTVQEASAPTGLTAIYALPETDQAEIDNKSDALLDFHRESRLQSARCTTYPPRRGMGK